jgi:DNA-binding MarR family transcriptional regulator
MAGSLEPAGKTVRSADATTIELEKTQRCLNFQLRRTARLVTRRYDATLRPLGLRSTQFNIMAILAQNGTMPLSRIAEFLEMERSALARNLRPLARRKLVRVSRGADKRMRVASLTAGGTRKFIEAFPVWERAHEALSERLGTPDSRRLLQALSTIRAVLGK